MRVIPKLSLLLVALSMVGLTSCGSPDSDMNRQDQISRLLEGTYELSSWNDGDQQYTSPTVRGRITFYDGTIFSFFITISIQIMLRLSLGWANIRWTEIRLGIATPTRRHLKRKMGLLPSPTTYLGVNSESTQWKN